MDLLIKNYDKHLCVLKPVITSDRNIESVIAKVKMIILNNPEQETILDLRKVNFLDCIKIGIIISTYHFLEFSGRKIKILVNNSETQKAISNMCFENIEVVCEYNKTELVSIA